MGVRLLALKAFTITTYQDSTRLGTVRSTSSFLETLFVFYELRAWIPLNNYLFLLPRPLFLLAPDPTTDRPRRAVPCAGQAGQRRKRLNVAYELKVRLMNI